MVSSSSESGGESSGSLGSVDPLLNTSGPPEEPRPKNLIIWKFNLVAVSVADSDPHRTEGRSRIHIKVISWIRIRINLQMTSQNVWNMSLFEHFFKVLSLYLEARIRICIKLKRRIRIRIKVTSRIWIRIHIKVASRIGIRICNTGTGTAFR